MGFRYGPEWEQRLFESEHHLDENQSTVLVMPTGNARARRLKLIKLRIPNTRVTCEARENPREQE